MYLRTFLKSLFINKWFVLNKMFHRIASNFSILYVYDTPGDFFSFRATSEYIEINIVNKCFAENFC